MKKDKLDKVVNKINNMKSVRESYPGWLLLPMDKWNNFSDTEREIPSLRPIFDGIDDDEIKLSFVYELNWRYRISLTPISEWIIDAIKKLISNQKLYKEHKKEITDLELTLLQYYRHNSDFDHFDKLYKELSDQALYIPKRTICYEGCLRCLGELKINKIAEICLLWDVNYGDYQNCLQKAEMLFILGWVNELEELLNNSGSVTNRVGVSLVFRIKSATFVLWKQLRYLQWP